MHKNLVTCSYCGVRFKTLAEPSAIGAPYWMCSDCMGQHVLGTNIFKPKPRPSWDEICMDTAIKLAKRSTCNTPNRQVGCVIVTPDYSSVLAWGYNGGAAGSDDECDFDAEVEKGSRCQCAHAEMNALTKLDTNGKRDLVMYVTLSPCQLCATLIVNAKCFKEVVYLDDYRAEKPIFILRQAGIQVRKYGT